MLDAFKRRFVLCFPLVVKTILRNRAELKNKIQETITARRAQPKGGFDLLTAMMNVRDEQTGEAIPDSQIIDECLTFLFAGQDTTGKQLIDQPFDRCSQFACLVYAFSW